MILQTPTTEELGREAVERYVDATGGGEAGSGLAWELVVAVVLLVIAAMVLAAAFHRHRTG